MTSIASAERLAKKLEATPNRSFNRTHYGKAA